ncbi:MAG TPA: isoleucine--tRNA ligase [Gaiellaceae bacterium]|nr:isoleucine--tRNA ligase [Gaiellaceae bacterium]
MFKPLPDKPDHPALEHQILALWEREGTFARLRERNRGGPTFSFMDGPITANAPAGIHHGMGRTLKDVFQRYKALRGFDSRYQNGFDSQGLHVEVQVEKQLGLNSKREIEEFGMDEFARRCRDFVAHFAGIQTEQSKRLGQWMDWDNSYFTFSDTNIEYIWRFLKEVQRRGWLYKGHRSTQWCPRCGTSLSKHEQAGDENYAELEHPSLFVRFPLKGRDGEALVVWTTTPWTLPANVAAAVKPDAEYGLTEDGRWVAVARFPDESFTRKVRGEDLVGLEYSGPFDELPAQEGVTHRVIPWDEVSLDEGTGIVHIAPGCGAEDFGLSRELDLAVIAPIDEAGRMLSPFGPFAGLTTTEVAAPVTNALQERGLLVQAGTIVHRYPICWRCQTPLVFRVVDDWFISADEIRQPMLDGNATVEWTPPHYGKRMDDWLRNMGDWNISRRRYFGLPLPFYECECGELNVIGSRAELEERALAGLDQLEELHRPWIDAVKIRCQACDAEVERIPEVGDAWLDAGIVHFSTLGWNNPAWVPEGNATGSARGLTGADLPDHAYWEQWFPADWVSEMRQQIRLWFYSQCFMAITLTGTQPYRQVLTYEKVLDENGREMHKSWGNSIELNEALDRMGADVMRWLYCEQNPSQDLRFGYGMAEDVKRRLLTFWNSVAFFITYASIASFDPAAPRGESNALDRWLDARTAQLVRDATAEYERFWTPGVVAAFESYTEDLSNWYIRRSRRRFWADDTAALGALFDSLTRALRVIAPVMPFLADYVWRHIVDEDESVHLVPYPEVGDVDETLLSEVADVRKVVELGRRARDESRLKLRQPLRRLVVEGAGLATGHGDEIADELRVKEVEFGAVDASELVVRPNLPVLGPKLGSALREIREQLASGAFEQLDGGRFRVGGHVLEAEEVLVERVGREGWAVASEDGVTVALDVSLDDELLLEGRLYDRIHEINVLRKESGLEVTDRIRLWLPDEDLFAPYGERIKSETLAVSLEAGELRLEKA